MQAQHRRSPIVVAARRPWIVACATLFLAAVSPVAAQTQRFSHAAWGEVLERFVDERGLVDYPSLAEDPNDLESYLAAIAAAGPANRPELFPDRDHELAYYINAYNALTFEGVLDKGPEIDSVWGITGTGVGFFALRKVELEGRSTTLKKLEDDIVRERYGDARIHAALNCASIGCPRLPREPFEGSRLDAQLDAEMREFVGEPRNVQVDRAAGTVTLSKIFDWFEEDFLADERELGVAEPTLIGYVNRYRPADAQIPAELEVRFADYDKRLNAQRSR